MEAEAQVAADKKALAEATAVREKQLAAFHEMEKDSIQAIENLKAAIIVLGKHHSEQPRDEGATNAAGKELQRWFFLQLDSKTEWRESSAEHSLDEFMEQNDYSTNVAPLATETKSTNFLQPSSAGWSTSDK